MGSGPAGVKVEETMARKRLGTLLEERGLINEFQLVAALSHQRKWKGKLGKSLIELGYLEEQQLYEVLAEQWQLPLLDLRDRKIPPEILNKISRKDAETLKALSVEEKEGKLVFAVADADLPDLEAKLSQLTGQPVQLALGRESLIENWIALISKVPVAAVQPVKRAFIRNSNGEMELAPDHLQAPPAPVEPLPPPQAAEPKTPEKEKPSAVEPKEPPLPEPLPLPEEPVPPREPNAAIPSLDLEVPSLDLPPLPPLPATPPPPGPTTPEPAGPSEDLWAMPDQEPAPPPAAAKPEPAPEPLPEPPSAESLFDLPPPVREETAPPKPSSVPDLGSSASLSPEEIALPGDEIEEISLPETPLPPKKEPEPPPPFISPPSEPTTPPLKPETAPSALAEEPIPLEEPEPVSEPIAPLEDLVSEEVKAEHIGFRGEIRPEHETRERLSTIEPKESAPASLEQRVARMEAELRELRALLEELKQKINR